MQKELKKRLTNAGSDEPWGKTTLFTKSSSPEKLMTNLRESIRDIRKESRKPQTVNTIYIPPMTENQHRSTGMNSYTGYRASYWDNSNKRKQRNVKEMECWGYGKTGHLYRDCRSPNKKESLKKTKKADIHFMLLQAGEYSVEDYEESQHSGHDRKDRKDENHDIGEYKSYYVEYSNHSQDGVIGELNERLDIHRIFGIAENWTEVHYRTTEEGPKEGFDGIPVDPGAQRLTGGIRQLLKYLKATGTEGTHLKEPKNYAISQVSEETLKQLAKLTSDSQLMTTAISSNFNAIL